MKLGLQMCYHSVFKVTIYVIRLISMTDHICFATMLFFFVGKNGNLVEY